MGTFIFILILFVAGLWIYDDKKILGICLILTIFLSIVVLHEDKTAKLKSTTQITKLIQITTGQQISGNISGSLFVLSGNIDSKNVYTFYIQNKDGSLLMESVDAKYTKIFQDEPKGEAELKRISFYFQNSWGEKYTSSYMNDLPETDSNGEIYELHIPKGSISNSTNLNLKGT